LRYQPCIETDVAICVPTSQSVRLREKSLADLASDELAHRVDIGLQTFEQLLVSTCLLFVAGDGVRQTGSERHGGRRRRLLRGTVFAVGTVGVGTLLSLSWVAGAVCDRLDAREHDRGWRSWVRSSRVCGRDRREDDWQMHSQSRVVDRGCDGQASRRWAQVMVGWLQLGQAGRGLCSRQAILTDSMDCRFGNVTSSGSSITILAWYVGWLFRDTAFGLSSLCHSLTIRCLAAGKRINTLLRP
jgi:hypothetical protein